MIFYKNLKKHKKTTEKNITFSVFGEGVISNEDDLISKPNECKVFHNFTLTDGSLKTGLGFKDLEVPSNRTSVDGWHTFDLEEAGITAIKDITMFRYRDSTNDIYYYHLYLVSQEDEVWYCLLIDTTGGSVINKSTTKVTDLISVIKYRVEGTDCLMYYIPTGMLYLAGYGKAFYQEVPAFLSCVVHYGKVFGITNTNRNELVYTDNLDIRDWQDDSGIVIEFLDDRGMFEKLVSFNDYVYLFRENGITKISEYSNIDEFSFDHLYTSSSKIYEKSVCVCGEEVFFATRDGLYSFNGSRVQKICEEYDNYFQNLDNMNCSSCCLDGKYYLATKFDFDDNLTVGCESATSYTNNVLFEVDINTQKVDVLRGVDIKKIISVDTPFYSKVVACFNGTYCGHLGELVHSGKLFTENLPKSWSSFTTDLGYKGKNKKIKEIILNTSTSVDVEIISDVETKTYSFEGSEKEQRRMASVNGKNFQFIFKTTEAECHISKPMIVFDVIS